MESGCYLNKRLAFVELNKAHTSLDTSNNSVAQTVLKVLVIELLWHKNTVSLGCMLVCGVFDAFRSIPMTFTVVFI